MTTWNLGEMVTVCMPYDDVAIDRFVKGVTALNAEGPAMGGEERAMGMVDDGRGGGVARARALHRIAG
jgi:hypothetical protein